MGKMTDQCGATESGTMVTNMSHGNTTNPNSNTNHHSVQGDHEDAPLETPNPIILGVTVVDFVRHFGSHSDPEPSRGPSN